MVSNVQFSRPLKSSSQSLPSPNGAYIASVFPSKLNIRETRSLEILRVVSLPSELAASIAWFLWSADSSRLLLATPDYFRLYSLNDPKFSATITSPTSGTAKVAHACFGAANEEICVFTEFGLKLTIFNLATSKAVDLNSPKLYHPGVANKGISYRPKTSHLALLSRSGGKDVVSIHVPGSLKIFRSWCPETVDAQGLAWSPDGRWIAVWESAGQGHKLIVCTPDGHPFKMWRGPTPITDDDRDVCLGAGIKLVEWSPSGAHIAIADYSGRIVLLAGPSFNENIAFFHSTTIMPSETCNIWSEKVVPIPFGFNRIFSQCQQPICPPTSTSPAATDPSLKIGTNVMAFDQSGTLLATKMESMPTTIWIWDVGTRALRAALTLHYPIARVIWHPTINELLMIRCEGKESSGLAYLWDPSWEAPRIIDFGTQLPEGKIMGKSVVRWLDVDSPSPNLFFSDSQDCILASIPEAQDGIVPWENAGSRALDLYSQQEDSLLSLVQPTGRRTVSANPTIPTIRKVDTSDEDSRWGNISSGSDEVDDTFQFRKCVDL